MSGATLAEEEYGEFKISKRGVVIMQAGMGAQSLRSIITS
jgi:hypothetical protein